ncbi:MAG: UvrD-helicase domain-containing protein, partial [Candidatus Nanopelagicales bacterium]
MREVKVELDFSLQAPPTPSFDPTALEILEEKAAALLITGSAGSGKTFLLEQLALKAIQEEKIAPEKIIFIAFSRHQARAIRKQITSYSNSPALMRITTFHSFAYGVVQQVVNQNPELEIFENL